MNTINNEQYQSVVFPMSASEKWEHMEAAMVKATKKWEEDVASLPVSEVEEIDLDVALTQLMYA